MAVSPTAPDIFSQDSSAVQDRERSPLSDYARRVQTDNGCTKAIHHKSVALVEYGRLESAYFANDPSGALLLRCNPPNQNYGNAC